MTLDDEHMTARLDRLDALRRDRELDWADWKAAVDERAECESVEAMETYWQGVMAQGRRSIHADQIWDGTS